MAFAASTTPASLGAQVLFGPVVHVGAPQHPGVATLVEELTLGNGSNAEEYRFLTAFLFAGRNGTIYVVDVGDTSTSLPRSFRSTVRQYDHAGTFVRAFTGAKGGSGMIVGAVGDVQELPDGSVLISDGRGVLVYSSSGRFLKRWSVQSISGDAGSRIFVDPAGSVMVRGRLAGETGEWMHRFTFDGRLAEVKPVTGEFTAPPIVGRAARPFAPRHLAAWSPMGYFVTAYTAQYAIVVHGRISYSAGVTRRPSWPLGIPGANIRNTTEVVGVQAAEREDWRESVTMFNRSGDESRRSWTWTGADIPFEKPPLEDIRVDGDGRIWVQLSQAAQLNPAVRVPREPTTDASIARRRWPEPMVHDVFEPSGGYIGRVRFPDGVGVTRVGWRTGFAVQGDTVWAVSYAANGAPMVKQYRINWGS